MTQQRLIVGAQASQAKGITIWGTIRDYFRANDVPMEYALFSSYETMSGALLRGEIDIAWNAPMAHVQCLIQSEGACRTLAMRDVDKNVRSIVIAKAGSGIEAVDDLRGRKVALGVPVSSELRLLPLHGLRASGFDLEREAELVDLEPQTYPDGQAWVDDGMIFKAVLAGEVDAGVIFEPYLPRFLQRAELEESAVQVVWASEPFCHCAFTARPGYPEEAGDQFVELLTAMDASDPEIAEMMQLENLSQWLPAEGSGWDALVDAVQEADFVGATY